jgi:protocatechuate 3,4-dioxygenase beta subunit
MNPFYYWLIAIILFVGNGCMQPQQEDLPECEWCGANEAPENVNWETTIAGKNEEGDRLIITGTIFKTDGKTPAADVILYLYHTNNKGIYPKQGDETGNGRRHGYLRGWVKTNENGEYKINTIKPAPYPSSAEPAHIHTVVKEPGKDEYWIDSIIFEGDALITPEFRKRLENRGGPGIITLSKENRVWRGIRNIVLENN